MENANPPLNGTGQSTAPQKGALGGLKVLIVDDDLDFADTLKRHVFEGCAQDGGVVVVSSIEAADEQLRAHMFDVCLLDFELADRYGLKQETLSRFAHILTALVFLSNRPSKASALRALSFGGKDFLIKSRLSSFDVAKSISYALYWKYREIELEASTVHDQVTGLGTVPLFDEHLRHALEVAKRGKEKIGLLMIGLTGMEPVLQDYNEAVSDELLKQVGERIVGKLRTSDVVARLSDQQFGAILVNVKSDAIVKSITGAVTDTIVGKPYTINGYTLKIGANVGTATYPDHAPNLDDLKSFADKALAEKRSKHGTPKLKDHAFGYY